MWTDRALRLLLVLQTLPALFVGSYPLNHWKVYSIEGIYSGLLIPHMAQGGEDGNGVWDFTTFTEGSTYAKGLMTQTHENEVLWDIDTGEAVGVVHNTEAGPHMVDYYDTTKVIAQITEVKTVTQLFCVPEAGYLEAHPPAMPKTSLATSLTRDCIGDKELQIGDGVQVDTGEQPCILEEKRLNDELTVVEIQSTTTCVMGKRPIAVAMCDFQAISSVYRITDNALRCTDMARENGHLFASYLPSEELCFGFSAYADIAWCKGNCACTQGYMTHLGTKPKKQCPTS